MMAGFDRRRLGGTVAGAALAAYASLVASPARAALLDQFIAPDVPGTDVQPNVTVLSRQRPEYEPLGVRLGDFTIRPQLTESTGYDDNATAPARRTAAPLSKRMRTSRRSTITPA
ncbi:MAG: outer membrane beta-barrel protein, partial [Acetobacteraceae bacterium]